MEPAQLVVHRLQGVVVLELNSLWVMAGGRDPHIPGLHLLAGDPGGR